MNESILNTPYLKEQIIPYIGNKRKLLPLICKAIDRIGYVDKEGSRFLDLFAGSGVVSRLGKVLGFEVFSNDWEYYSYIINYSYLIVDHSDLDMLYEEWGGIENTISYFNNLPAPEYEEQFIAKYYSPKNDSSADYKKERLFYTRYNGLIIDKVRNEIEKLYPEDKVIKNEKYKIEKYLLLSILLYQAATHTNTSGVFKAYHKGFGGFSGDALSRIMKKIEMEKPILINGKYKSHVYMEDANLLVKSEAFKNIKFDIVYIDPPYNQHQYGSNYHLLNTIARWDKENLESQLNGALKTKKAGIREDWVNTRSLYCYRDSAEKLFEDLLRSINGRYLLISYNTEGIIPIEHVISIASSVGKTEIIGNEYIKYRGGKQSIERVNNNFEFILIVDKDKNNSVKNLFDLKFELLKRKLQLQFKKSYCLEKLKGYFNLLEDYRIEFSSDKKRVVLKTRFYFRLFENDLRQLYKNIKSDKEGYVLLNKLSSALENAQCVNIPEEIDEIIRIIESEGDCKDLVNEIPVLLKKIAHKKYRKTFYLYINKVKNLDSSKLELINEKIRDVELLAEKRFNG